jgi:Sortase domain
VIAGALAVLAPSPEPTAVAAPPGVAGATLPVAGNGAVPVQVAAPTRVQLPSLGVDSALARLGVDSAGALMPPSDFTEAGWFTGGPAPGEVGPAVIAGHVDSRTGPAVFFRLRDIAVGDPVLVGRADGSTAQFTVTRVARHAKNAFPTAEVYGPTPDAQLRLITCGGDFDRANRSYLDNVVVYATLTG